MKRTNMKLNIALLISVVTLFVTDLKAQQDAQYSQYMFNGIYINPAYAGYREQLNAHAFYRNQWTGVEGAPKSMSLAIDATANERKVGLALQLSSDKLGAQQNLAAYANYAYRLKMNADGSSRLAFGIGLGVIQLGIDGSKLNPNDPEINQPVSSQYSVMPDARIGVFYSDDRYYAGLSVDNLISKYIDVTRYAYIPQPKEHIFLTAGMLVPFSREMVLKPSFLIKDDLAGPTSLDINAFLIFDDKLWVGGSYRTAVKLYDKSHLQKDLVKQSALVGAIEIFPSDRWRIGYAYDYSLGKLKNYAGSTHEISIGYFFRNKNVRMLTPRYF
ncbi:PorP/SprF family type IX secretion system membrane protein [Pedobacter montanisoli]|uniref:Type IX secretion system membrane protein PorP/SprF n=1 Tax=Pedobacter montanisoli TaxID=2923277 RepID=A0ABS9ZZS5_9SPHI|nr:type IX secretion system membrane protein PorP/SprF [Pedobacter montanisoli]MCJ0743813.1 type IX secretion system membrane protein PorP/SprF [Pedobacter montanisoli]